MNLIDLLTLQYRYKDMSEMTREIEGDKMI